MENKLRDIQLTKLTERAKELKCIYQVMEILKKEDSDLHMVFRAVLEAIPPGWQHPTVCESRILFEGREYASVDFSETEWIQEAEIIIDNHIAGRVQVVYLQKIFETENPFLPEEQKLLNAIAESLSQFIFFRRLKKTLEDSHSYENGNEQAEDSSLLAYESDEHWKWRYHVSQKLAEQMDMDRLGIEAVYLIGSTKNGNAGPASDIDLLVHFTGNESQREALTAWIEGWGLGLAELNFMKTGYRTKGSLIDCHIITDEDIRLKTSYAVMIGSVDNSAKILRSKII
jgi:predicted nucleotidyltransferase